jgi:pilus assembly protein CpaC
VPSPSQPMVTGKVLPVVANVLAGMAMNSTLEHRSSGCEPRPSRRWVLALILACCGLAGWAAAQPPACPPCPYCPPPSPPPVAEKGPRPPTGPEAVSAFVDGLTSNDAAFEVLLGQGRILTTKENLAVQGKPPALIALGDPTVVDFVVVSPRQIRLVGKRIGVTDLSITTPNDRVYSFEVRVTADLDVLRGQLHCLFPDTSLKLAQVRDHVVVAGQARDTVQVNRILETIRAYLVSVRATEVNTTAGQMAGPARPAGAALAPDRVPPPKPDEQPPIKPEANLPRAEIEQAAFQPLDKGFPRAVEATRPIGPGGLEAAAAGFYVSPELGRVAAAAATVPEPRIINLLKVPGSQQVLLKVRVAELNRTALREIGSDLLWVDHNEGSLVGTQIGGGSVMATGVIKSLGGLTVSRDPAKTFFATSPNTTVFGIFEGANFEFLLRALRRNAVLKILAEPNLVALNGQQANFLAGGEFPVPIAQASTGGAGTSVTVLFKKFGVSLAFLPFILDGDVIRMTVDPEVSSIDFAVGTVLVPGGTPVPGLNTRSAHTTVELRQGQTLAIAGLLQVSLDASTNRIPGLGDLPVLAPFFSNTSSTRTEKELIVLVTPYLIEPMNPDQVPPSPGDEVNEPNDLEFYLLSRIEGRTGKDFRSTTNYDDALHVLRCFMKLHNDHVKGPFGFCD